MNYPTRRDRLAAELQARRSRRRRSLTVGALGVTTAAGALLAGVAPASANDGSQQASSYQDWSYQGSSSSSSETSSVSAGTTSTAASASDYSTASAGSSSEGASYQLASYSSTSGSYGAAADWAVSTANDSSVGYSYGGNGPSVYDCSGFTQNAFAQAGVDLPRTASAQYSAASQYVGLDELQVGDLVFWSNNGSASGVYHVAIYIGDGQIAHARNPSMGVSITDVDYSPWNMMGTAARY